MRHLFAIALGSLLAAGCIGAVGQEGQDTKGPDAGSDTTGKQGPTLYANDVHPIMNRCSGGACHNADAVSAALGKYYLPDAAETYTKLTTAAPSIVGAGALAYQSGTAPILTKIAAGHQAVIYTDDEKLKIAGWLQKEFDERKDDTGTNPPVVDAKQVIKTFSGCLTLADFNTAQMSQKWGAAIADSPAQACKGCHSVGGDGFVANQTANVMFPVISEYTAYMLKFFTVDTNVTPAKVVINTGSFTNAGITIPNHPRFQMTSPSVKAGMDALQAWYDLALAKQAANMCGTPTLKD